MRKLKLRRWVKVTLIAIGFITLFIISNNHTNKAIEQCVKAGHSQSYCENGLK